MKKGPPGAAASRPCPPFRWAMQSFRPLFVFALFCVNVLSQPALSQHPRGLSSAQLPESWFDFDLHSKCNFPVNLTTRPTTAISTILLGQSWRGVRCSDSVSSLRGCTRCPFGAHCGFSPILGRHFVCLTVDAAFLPPIDHRIQGLIFFSLGFP